MDHAVAAHEYRDKYSKKNIQGDFKNLAFLFSLYCMQGAPIGIAICLPLVMHGKLTYAQQSLYSLVSIPFSIKLLWAPIVDTLHFPQSGLRKSWLVPTQFACSFAMLFGGLSGQVGHWVDKPAEGMNLVYLTAYFFFLFFLMATQDIAVDGWALTLLSKENRYLASPVNTVGQSFGFSLANFGFFALSNEDFVNHWIRTVPSKGGLITIDQFLVFWSVVSFVISFVICLKSESQIIEIQIQKSTRISENFEIPDSVRKRTKISDNLKDLDGETEKGSCDDTSSMGVQIIEASNVIEIPERNVPRWPELCVGYSRLWKLLALPAVQTVSLVLLFVRMGFGPVDAASSLKYVEYGIPKENVAILYQMKMPITVVTASLVGRMTGRKPLSMFFSGFILRIVVNVLIGVFGFVVVRNYQSGSLSRILLVMFLLEILNTITSDIMFVSQMSFFASVCDESMGGTYMTFLNTVANLGSKIASSGCLVLIELLSRRECEGPVIPGVVCPTIFDGYFLILPLGLLISLFCAPFLKSVLTRLELRKENEWRISEEQEQEQEQ